MPEQEQEKDKPKRTTIRERVQFDQKFLVISLFLVVSVVAVSFSAKSLFNGSGEGPISFSDNIFGKIALFAPFVMLTIVFLYYFLRLIVANESWSRFLIPLILAIGIGIGYGVLAKYINEFIQEQTDITLPITDTETTNPFPGTDTGPPPSGSFPPGSNSPGPSDGSPFSMDQIISTILIIISVCFIIITTIVVTIDFLRKREEEYHEKVERKEIRWLPNADVMDHRLRVIRAYHEGSYSLMDLGIKSERSMTPGEFEKNVKEKATSIGEPFTDLTDLYEEARFSHHTISSLQSEKAEERLKTISKKLQKQTVPQKVQEGPEELPLSNEEETRKPANEEEREGEEKISEEMEDK